MNLQSRISKLEERHGSPYANLSPGEIRAKLEELKKIALEVLTPKEHAEMMAWIEHQCAATE
ncbi:MAG: hypothetical protein PHE55_14455 [Methylococcaceae bacterium]|nr:hypothetical protein [Methylococcaceae bacterium]